MVDGGRTRVVAHQAQQRVTVRLRELCRRGDLHQRCVGAPGCLGAGDGGPTGVDRQPLCPEGPGEQPVDAALAGARRQVQPVGEHHVAVAHRRAQRAGGDSHDGGGHQCFLKAT